MKFRRSVKSEKHDSSKAVQIAIPQKDAIAIEPPKKVIKALYDYEAPTEPNIYLPFSAGDFLHVVSREDDADWYEACNPLKNERGLVPVKYFQEVGKTVRDSAESGKSGSATHDSGYAEGTAPPTVKAATSNPYEPPVPMPGHRSSKSVGRNVGGVYGIVSYDFHAERPDELDAKEGEAIIVIAQSNPEWFVAKPITRLGGPGLIPASFIEIRDMTTGKAVADPSEAVQKAGIPKVEEWKKMAAEYKNTSIPLGTVSSSQQIQNLQMGLDRLSMGAGQGHDRNTAAAPPFAPVRASVPKFRFVDDKFHFTIECKLSNGTHWDLSRIYEDFYELQINLINAFPDEAGQRPPKERVLPYMPGPVQYVTEHISEGRRQNLNDYLRDLLKLEPKITCCILVRDFFAPRPGDFEVDPSVTDLEEHARAELLPEQRDNRYSATSQTYQNGGYQQQQLQSQQVSYPNDASTHQRQQPSLSGLHSGQHTRTPSTSSQQQLQLQQQQPQPYLQSLQQSANNSSGTSLAPQVKVKAWFDRETCVVIRMPPRGQFNFDMLYSRIVERRRLEYKGQDQDEEGGLDIEYRDERNGEYYRLEGDEDLDIAVERNDKLTLAVRAAGQ